ncbi:hypothetical protein HGG75_22875 [Ochrobactrum pseudogrignonense]|nr:hypothetical protein [Brucella pseudogrignonensis]
MRGQSTPWTEVDLSVARAIATYLRDVILRQSEISEKERIRTDQRRRILNAELNHRVKISCRLSNPSPDRPGWVLRVLKTTGKLWKGGFARSPRRMINHSMAQRAA